MRHIKIFLIVYFNLETFKFKKFKNLKEYIQTKKFFVVRQIISRNIKITYQFKINFKKEIRKLKKF